jgi:hypothetical protein
MEKLAKSKKIIPTKVSTCNDKYINILLEVYQCKTERCVLERMKKDEDDEDVIEEIDKSLENIKPEGPALTTTWLNNDNIDRVLDSYSKELPDFRYYNTCLMNLAEGSLSRINILEDYENNIKHSVCVVNTTRVCHPGRPCGDHWVCFHVDMTDRDHVVFEYFNSAGGSQPPEIITLFKQQKNMLQQKYPNIKITVKYNDIVHQNGNSECGVYCLYFIRSRLEGTDMERFKNARISDEAMIMFRRYIFDLPSIFD